MPTEDMIERAARATERATHPEWDDDEFEIWWKSDPFFCTKVTSWGHFTGTRKEYCLWAARTTLEAALTPQGDVGEIVEAEAQELANSILKEVGWRGADKIDRWSASRLMVAMAKRSYPSDLLTAQAAQIASLTAEQDDARRQIYDLLESYVNEHCDPVPEWGPLPSINGMISQLDNATTITRDFKARATAAEAEAKRLREVMHRLDDKRAPGVKALPAWACGIIRAALAEGGEVER